LKNLTNYNSNTDISITWLHIMYVNIYVNKRTTFKVHNCPVILRISRLKILISNKDENDINFEQLQYRKSVLSIDRSDTESNARCIWHAACSISKSWYSPKRTEFAQISLSLILSVRTVSDDVRANPRFTGNQRGKRV